MCHNLKSPDASIVVVQLEVANVRSAGVQLLLLTILLILHTVYAKSVKLLKLFMHGIAIIVANYLPKTGCLIRQMITKLLTNTARIAVVGAIWKISSVGTADLILSQLLHLTINQSISTL